MSSEAATLTRNEDGGNCAAAADRDVQPIPRYFYDEPKQMIIPQLAAGVAILMTVYATLSCEFVQTEQRFLGFQYPNSKSKFGIGLYSRESPIDNDNSCVWFDGDDFGTLFDTAFFMAVGANTLSGAAGFLTYFFSLFMWFCPCCAMRWSIAIQTAFYFMCFLSTCFSQSIYWSEVCNENKCNVDPDGSEGSLCFQSHCSIGKGSAVAFCAAPFWLLASILTFRLRPHCLPSPPEKKRDKESGILWFGSRIRLPWGGRRQVQRDGDYDPALSTSDHLYVGLEEFIRDLDHSLDDISIDDLSILIDDNGNISCSELDRDKKKHAAAASTSHLGVPPHRMCLSIYSRSDVESFIIRLFVFVGLEAIQWPDIVQNHDEVMLIIMKYAIHARMISNEFSIPLLLCFFLFFCNGMVILYNYRSVS